MGTVLIIAIVALLIAFIAGSLLLGLTIKLLYFAISGLIVGAVARLIVPGEQQMGIAATAGFGVAGSLLGGALAGGLFGLGTIGQALGAVLVSAGLIATMAKTKS